MSSRDSPHCRSPGPSSEKVPRPNTPADKSNTELEPSNKMKTAVTVLQEMMVKLQETPEYECIAQSGPQHSAMFEYRCIARGLTVTASARSKKEAKQESARIMLLALAARGESVPPPYGVPQASANPSAGMSSANASTSVPLNSHTYVALLKDLCEEYRLPAVEFELISDTGPPHLRHFTMRARLGQHERFGTSTTKKAARQLAAEQLYTYMRENLARLTKDFVEEDALVRAHDRAMDRYVELREDIIWRPDLSQRVADYHMGLITHIESSKREMANSILTAGKEGALGNDEAVLDEAAEALGLTVTRCGLGSLRLVELAPTAPALTFAGLSDAEATAAALRYLRLNITPIWK